MGLWIMKATGKANAEGMTMEELTNKLMVDEL